MYFFFFKQKTAYEMRISDWSSDVCSSDLAACRPHATVPFEAHLMVEQPDELAARYVEAGCQMLIVHAEACRHLHSTLANIRELGAQPAVALNPATPVDAVAHVLDLVDLVLVLTVHPGFRGQAYIPPMETTVAPVRGSRLVGGAGLDVKGGVGVGAPREDYATTTT